MISVKKDEPNITITVKVMNMTDGPFSTNEDRSIEYTKG